MRSPANFPAHLVSVLDLSEQQIGYVFERASEMRMMPRQEAAMILQGMILAVLFFQPSTRTRLGFEAAALRLGGKVTGFADPGSTRSVDYIAETLDDTVRVVSEFSDAIVLRHYVSGAGRRASQAAHCPVINGGDGANEHPTQALSDAWLMHRRCGGLSGLVVGLVGDPGTRVLRSLVYLLARLQVRRLLFLVPPSVPFQADPAQKYVHTTLPADLVMALKAAGTAYEFRSDVTELLEEADAIEMMPIDVPALEADPRSLAPHGYVTPERYRVTASKIRAIASKALILHPGPRKDELHTDVDSLPSGLYFDQVADAIYLRMAVLEILCKTRGS